MWLGTIILGIAVWVMYGSETGDFLLKADIDSTGVTLDVIKSIAAEIPFVGIIAEYAANIHDVSSSFYLQGGYGVLHDFGKAILLFLVMHFSVGFIKGACDMLGKGLSPSTPYALIYRGLSNIALGFCICLSSIIIMCVLHSITLKWWLDTFGNGSVSNWGYLIVLVLLVAIVFLVLPEGGRKSLLDKLRIMLTDMGLVICAIMLGFSLLVIAQGGAGSKQATITGIVFPYIACCAGLVILLRIRFRNT